MFNKVTLIGRLTKDPELRHTEQENPVPVVTLTLAVDRPYFTEGKKQVDFIEVEAWRKKAEVITKNLSKGRLILVEGWLKVERYTDSKDIKRRAYKIVAEEVRFLDYPKKDSTAVENEDGQGPSETGNGYGLNY